MLLTRGMYNYYYYCYCCCTAVLCCSTACCCNVLPPRPAPPGTTQTNLVLRRQGGHRPTLRSWRKAFATAMMGCNHAMFDIHTRTYVACLSCIIRTVLFLQEDGPSVHRGDGRHGKRGRGGGSGSRACQSGGEHDRRLAVVMVVVVIACL